MPLAIALAASRCVNFAQMFHFDNTFPSSQTHRVVLCVENDDFAWFEVTQTSNLTKNEKTGSRHISVFHTLHQVSHQIKAASGWASSPPCSPRFGTMRADAQPLAIASFPAANGTSGIGRCSGHDSMSNDARCKHAVVGFLACNCS